MAKLVTRTFLTTKAQALVANTETKELETVEITLPTTYKDEKALDKALAKAVVAPKKFVSVVGSTVIETRYGMTEEEFLANAKELPLLPKTNA